MSLHLDRTTCIWGASGSGKTILAKKLISDARPRQLVVIDPMAESGTDLRGIQAALERGDKSVTINSSRRDWQIAAILLALNHSTTETPVYVMADEASGYLNKASDSLMHVVTKGRHAGFGIMIISQRPATVDTTIRSQAAETYWMRLGEHVDLSTARKTLGPEAEKLPDFKPGEFILKGI